MITLWQARGFATIFSGVVKMKIVNFQNFDWYISFESSFNPLVDDSRVKILYKTETSEWLRAIIYTIIQNKMKKMKYRLCFRNAMDYVFYLESQDMLKIFLFRLRMTS